jgi:serine/threonine protein kinase
LIVLKLFRSFFFFFLPNTTIFHSDLKLSNLLLSEGGGLLKIADFGLATRLSLPDEEHFTLCGTPNYIAPEVIDAKGGHAHGLPADLFSVGCLLHMLLTATPPFPNQAKKEEGNNQTQLVSVSTPWSPPLNSTLSAASIDVLSRLLSVDPAQRISARDVLHHSFFKDASLPIRSPSVHSTASSIQPSLSLQQFRPSSSSSIDSPPNSHKPPKVNHQPVRRDNSGNARNKQQVEMEDEDSLIVNIQTMKQKSMKNGSGVSRQQLISHPASDEITTSTLAANGGDISINSRISAATVPRFKPVPRRLNPPAVSSSHGPSLTITPAASSPPPPVPPSSTIKLRRPVVVVGSDVIVDERMKKTTGCFEPVRDKETTPSPPIPTPPPDLNLRQFSPPKHPLPWERRHKAPPAAPLTSRSNSSRNNGMVHGRRQQQQQQCFIGSDALFSSSTDRSSKSSDYNVNQLKLHHSAIACMSESLFTSPQEKLVGSKDKHHRRTNSLHLSYSTSTSSSSSSSSSHSSVLSLLGQHNHSQESMMKPPRPLDTTRLRPFSHVATTHCFYINFNGEAVIWLKDGQIPSKVTNKSVDYSGSGGGEVSGLWMRVSSDGVDVMVGGLTCPTHLSDQESNQADLVPEVVTRFDLSELPRSLWEAYRFLKSSVRILKSNTPKIELYLYSASSYQLALTNQTLGDEGYLVKFTMMENGPLPDFVGEWNDGTKLRYGLGHKGTLLEVHMPSGKFRWSPNQQSDKHRKNNSLHETPVKVSNTTKNISSSSSGGVGKQACPTSNSHHVNKLQWPSVVPSHVSDHISVTQRAFQFCLNVERSAMRSHDICQLNIKGNPGDSTAVIGRESYPIEVHEVYDVITGPDADKVAFDLGQNSTKNSSRVRVSSTQLSEKVCHETKEAAVTDNGMNSLDHYLFDSNHQTNMKPIKSSNEELMIDDEDEGELSSLGSSSPPPIDDVLLNDASIGGRCGDGSLKIRFKVRDNADDNCDMLIVSLCLCLFFSNLLMNQIRTN